MANNPTPFPDLPNINILESGKSSLFCNYVFKAIPLAFDESLSYYECLCGLLSYLKNTIIPTVNNNAEAVVELQNLYGELHDYVENYFNNLEVQEEINNKLDDMVEDGTLSSMLNEYLQDLTPSLKPNINLKMPVGMTTFFRNLSLESLNNQIENIEKYFDSLKQQVRFQFNSETLQFDLVESDNIENQIAVINQYIQDGYKFDGLHFYQTGNLYTLFQTYGSDRVCLAYYNAIVDFIDSLPYKNEVHTLWILNEPNNNAMSSTYASDVIGLINNLKALDYYVSIPYANAYAITDTDQTIVNACDFISLNLYPFNDVYGEKTSIKQMAERFNKEFRIVERYLKTKDLVISECGCSSSWDSFNYPPSYINEENGKPISIFLEGFFQSNFISNIKSFYIWYYVDAYMYAENTILSMKNSTEVRYNG